MDFFGGRAGVLDVAFSRADINPPVGIAHGNWGASTHSRAEAIDLPLWASALAVHDVASDVTALMVECDLGGLSFAQAGAIRDAVRKMSEGYIGELYMARGLCFKWRNTIGRAAPEAGEPWQVSKIYWSVWSKKRIELTHAKYLELELESWERWVKSLGKGLRRMWWRR